MPRTPNHAASDVEYAALADGETYASAADLLGAQDRAEAIIRIPRWTRDGRPLVLRIRTLDLPTQERISDTARTKDHLTKQIVRDEAKFVALTLQACCVQPTLDAGQAMLLATSKNPTVLAAIVNFVWNDLAYFSPEQIERIVHELANLPSDPDGDDPE